MIQPLQSLCHKAIPIVSDCQHRSKPQSVLCSDRGTKSSVLVRFARADQGIAFVTDHVIPAGSGRSSDWCVCHCDVNKTRCNGLLIELKGRGFKHAVEQLASTYLQLRRNWPSLNVGRCFAVLSGKQIPSIKSGDYKVIGRYALPGFQHARARKGLAIDV